MSILQSIFLGSHGRYNIAGYDVEFTEGVAYSYPDNSYLLRLVNCVARALGNLHIVTQQYLHILVHEMGHASASRWLDPEGRFPSIKIFTNSGTGRTRRPFLGDDGAEWKNNVINLAGPMANMLFSGSKLVLAAALKSYISLPVAFILGAGTLIFMVGELFYAGHSAINQDDGDFGLIASSGAIPLFIATAALVGTFALSIFCAVTLW